MIYLDNGATTPVCAEAEEACSRSFKNFGNPSSQHGLGLNAKKAIMTSAGKIERILNAEEGTFYFTSGATEANNWAIFGTALKSRKGNHIITSKTEHPSVLAPIRELEKQGFRVTYINVDKSGNLDLRELLAAIGDDTVLVSIMAVNNETGFVNDISEIGKRIKQLNEKTVFHVDGVCAFCKIPVNVKTSKIDLFSISGHKLHAPKGIGGLYIREGIHINPLIWGGGQQKDMRSGTENTHFIEALAAAAEMCAKRQDENTERVLRLRNKLKDGVLNFDAEINGCAESTKASPYVLNVGFKWIKAQIMINALEQRGIYAAAGSACSSNRTGKKAKSSVLSAMGIDKATEEGAVRFSFSIFNYEEEIDICLALLNEIYKKYRGKI